MDAVFTRTEPPDWLLAMWKEIDDKTFGAGFACLTADAVCNLGVADWHGREAIRSNLKAFVDTGFTALHHVEECWDGGAPKVFRGTVDMTPDDRTRPTVHPSMAHFFYMDERFSLVTTVGAPQAVVADDLRLELLFPADDATEERHVDFMAAHARP